MSGEYGMEQRSCDLKAADPCGPGAVSHCISQGTLVPAWEVGGCPAPP